MDESELFPSLGSAVLLRGSTISDRLIQLSYEANRYELLQQYRLAPQALSQSISIYGAHPSIPITQWPELDEGILYFIDFTDARVKNALPYFRPSVSALTAYFATNSLVGPYDRASLWMPIRPEASGRQDYARNTRRDADGVIEAQPEPSDPWAPGSGPQRQRQAMGQFPEAYARMAGNGQASGARLESYMGVRRSGSARVMRLSGSETGRASRILPQEHWIAQNSQIMPTASRSSLRNPTRPVAWPGEWHRPVDRLLTLPIAGTAGLQQPSDTGRWHGSPPRPTYPPSAIFTPTMAQPDMGGPPNYRHSSRNVPRGATALTIGRVDFGHGPDFPAPRPVSGQVNRAAQRRARSGSPRGRGAARGRGTEYRRYH